MTSCDGSNGPNQPKIFRSVLSICLNYQDVEEDDFNEGIILPPLIIQLRKILDQYPDDSQILKELIQNAEDAGAKTIKFMYDRHSYGTNSRFLYHPGLAKFQGPSLFAHNDALFDDEDWKGIRMLSQSVKQNDPFKVGYFGLGFKSIFHITDLPSVLSGSRLGMIDPHQRCFPAATHSWNLAKKQDLIDTLPDQFAPFLRVFDCCKDVFQEGHYSGTLFRFPLRTHVSPLSDSLYDKEKIHRLFRSFQSDAHLTLLFLKHLETIEVYERDELSVRPRLLFKVQIAQECLENVRLKRSEFLNKAKSGTWLDKPLMSTYPITIETIRVEGTKEHTKTYRWLVTNYYSGGQVSAIFRKLHRDTDLSYPPWVGVAMPLNIEADNANLNEDIFELDDSDGHVFCFLPLPYEKQTPTGLPVHINGFFALEQNRKYLKWPNSGQRQEELMDKRLLWNQCLLKESIPKAYTELILQAIRMHQSEMNAHINIATIYRAFPDFKKIDRKWEIIMIPLFSELLKHSVVHTAARGGEWVEPRDAIFNTMEEEDVIKMVALKVLGENNVRVALVPEHVLHAIKTCCHINLAKITPNLVSSSYRSVQNNCDIQSASYHYEERLNLLRYLLKSRKYELIDGLELLPLANGGFHKFFTNPRRADRIIYMATADHPQILLPGMDDHFLESDMDEDILKALGRAATRGYTQLKLLSREMVVDLLPKCLPKDWVQGIPVTWNPADPGQPQEGWLELLWVYLQKHFRRDLSMYESLSIMPVSVLPDSMELVPLYTISGIVVKQLDGMSLGERLEGILHRLGVVVLEHLPDYVKSHPMVLEYYVNTPSYIGVLRTLHRITEHVGYDKFLRVFHDVTDDDDKRHLREMFSRMSPFHLQPEHRPILCKLPLFETLEGSQTLPSHFVSQEEVQIGAPATQLPIHVSKPLLDIRSRDSQNLASLLDVHRITVIDLLRKIVFPDIEGAYYEPEQIETVMLYVLRHYYSYVEMDETFIETLKSLPFLPRKDMFVTPERLYDPAQQLLKTLFLGEENFPTGPYAEPTIIAILRQIGLKGQADVETEDLIETALQIQDSIRKDENEQKEAVSKSGALLDYLTRHMNKLYESSDGKELHEHLAGIKWVCSLKTKPNFYPISLFWCQGESVFAKPCEMRNLKYASICGSVVPVVSSGVSEDLGKVFGWDMPPHLQQIVSHLVNVVNSYEPSEKAKYMEIATRVYEELMQHEPENILRVFERNHLTKWIWHGEGFTETERIVFKEPFMDLRPFVFNIPTEVSKFRELFEKCGVQEDCSLPEVLQMVKKKYDGSEQPVSDVKFKRDLHICVSILNEIKANFTEEQLPDLQEQLMLPVHNEKDPRRMRLAPLPDCTFCDQEWMRAGYDLRDLLDEEEEEMLFVHPNVPTSTSEALGVPTLMSRMLDAEELDFSFGQTDSLTHRLNVLLQDYTDGFAVPKELVQNADDAGATEVKFLYDERENKNAMTCLIDESMKECQGPALWVYNDAVFTDDDFENITKLSGATKESQTEKIGRFGLGFNAVYNLTDVPSFISRHNIVIFDPHTTHLGKSIRNKSKPGIKIDMRKHKRKLRRLGNQFKPYNGVFGCDLCPDSNQESYDSTLFRFPLRTKSQAVTSEICQKHYDQKEMKTLLQMLINGAERLLLFTQNVTKITLYHMSRASADARLPSEVFSVSKTPLKILRELDFQMPLSDAAQKLPASKQSFIKQCSILKACTETMRKIKEGKMRKNSTTPTSTMVLQVDCVSTAHSVRLLGGHVSHTSAPWLVCSCMGTGESLKMACMEENLLPTAGVAVPLKYDSQRGMYGPEPILHPTNSERPFGNVFTYLPLPIHTGLPIHINGAFAVTSNRRYLCERNEDDKFDVRAIWNEALLSDAVTDSYLQMLDDLTRISEPGMFPFTLLWPKLEAIDSNCKMLSKSFYQLIAQVNSSMPAFYSDGTRWVPLTDAVFLDPVFRHSEVGETAMDVFRDCVRGTVTCVIDMPEFARKGYSNAKAEETILERSYDLERFLKEILLPNIESIHSAQRDPLIIHALRQDDEKIDKLLIDTNCIPVSPDGEMLRSPEELVDPGGNLATLYLPQDGRFPYGDRTYASKDILVILKRLGMSSDDMSWDDVIERASSLYELDFHGAKRRSQSLIHYMEKKLERENGEQVITYYERLKDVAFLPIMKRPRTITMQWKGDEFPEEQFLSPLEIYPSEKLPLVCCVEPIVDETVFPKNSEHVKKFFGFEDKIPSLDMVLLQLDTIVETDFASEDRSVLDEVQKISGVIYEYLQTKLETVESKDVFTTIIERLKDQPFIFCNGLFLKPRQVAFNFPHHCAPYIFGLPEVMGRNYGVLFKKVGVRDTFETKDFVETLQTMHATFTTNPLDKESLKLALRLVNLLNESLTEAHLPLSEVVELFGSIYIPDSNSILHDAVDLCYNEPECQWLPQDDDLLLSHPLIPYAISKQLGVNTRREEVLRKHSKGIPFGQRERLTNRIKRILSSYPCDKEILKELLQNADDAGASELHFVSDGRQHGTERVFDDTWKPLQGPALCVYNNSPFTEVDLEGIQRLGEGSKSADPNKTGQYGVGFNCVYHLTDVPSFLTKSKAVGETLCIFDPHACYIPGATLEEPGRRYEDVEGLRTIFTDVFPCYLEDKFDLSNATMFRFPLRTKELAENSELSEQPMTIEKLDNLLVKFKRELFDCLLFVNSVKTISVSEVDKLTNRLTKTYTVNVEISEKDQASRKAFAKFLRDTATRVHNGEIGVWEVPPQEVSYVIKLADNKGYWEKWLVTQRVGYPDGTKISVSLYDALKRGDLALLPRGGVAALLENSDPQTPFRPMKAFCFLPLPLKTTLPVQINGHFALDHEARRNLWIDDENSPKTEWNMAIIKHIIARAYVSMMRKAPSFLCSTHQEALNTSFFATKENEIPNIEFYSNLFPHFKTNEVYWRSVVENVYRIIDVTQEPVLPVLRARSFASIDQSSDDTLTFQDDKPEVEVEWVTTGGDGRTLLRPFFDNLDTTFLDEVDGTTGIVTPRNRMKSTPKKKSRRAQLRHVLLASGYKLLHLPLDVYQAFREAGVQAECISPGSVIQFYRSYQTALQACNIGSLPACITNTPFRSTNTLRIVLQYCIQDRETFFTCLDGLPFLLSEDEQLRVFNDDEAPFLTEYYKLLPECSFMFVHHKLVETIFEGVEPEDHHVFQRFDIPALASLLVNVLDEKKFRNGHHQLLWKEQEGVLPDAPWIRNLWAFIKSECLRLTSGRDLSDEEMAEQIKVFLKPLRDWCLLPGQIPSLKRNKLRDQKEKSDADKEELYLVPIGMAETVIDFTQSSIMSYGVRDSLRKMQLPELNGHLLDGTSWSPMPGKNGQSSLNASLNETVTTSTSDIARLLVATLEKPQSVLQVLHYRTKTRSSDGSLRQDDCNYILKYFSEYVGDWLEDKMTIAKLRYLPFYLTVHGDLISLNEHIVYALPNDIPTADMHIWEKESGIIFLRSNKNLFGLHEKLGCLSLTITEVYTKFIFKNFQLLSPEARIIHLQFLKDGKLQQMEKAEKDLLLVGLRHLEFMSDEVGKLHKACHFYDPYHSVFKVMLGDNPSAFPPSPFNEFKWLDFLRMIGMQHEITVEMFIEFAFNVAQEASANPTEKTFNKSRTLLTHLFRRHNLPSEGLLHKIADIKFIPPAKINSMLQKIYPQFGYRADGYLEYISFFDSIPENHEYLVWTSAHLLPNWANPFKLTQNDVSCSYAENHLLHKFENYRDNIAKLLGIASEPPVLSVVHHVRNICTNAYNANTPDELRSFMKADVMKVVYKFLQKKEDELDEEVKVALSDCPCIIVELGHNMMKPFQVVINMMEEDQIHPYLYKVPTELGEFKNLFLFLGASLNATVDQFAMVLNNIRNETKCLKLHPNELRAAFKAVAGLFHTLEKHPKDPIHSLTLFLPSMSGTLVRARELVFNDDPSYTDRIRDFDRPFIVDLSECGLSALDCDDLIKLLPKQLQPAMLTSIVHEILEPNSRETVSALGIAERLKHQLNSKAFSLGIARLIRHEHHRSGHKIQQETLDVIQLKLNNIRVFGVEKVVTYLEYSKRRIPGSETESECFVDKTEGAHEDEQLWNIYVDTSATMSEELLVCVAEVVNRIIGGLLRNSVHYLQPILSCPPHAISKVLDRLKIRPDHTVDVKQPTLPTPGTFIPIEDHHLLKEDFEEYELGEYVGYELEDDDANDGQLFVYAIIVEKIIEEVPEGEEFLFFSQKYKINVGDAHSTVVASITDLYKFHRVEGFVSRNTSFMDDSFEGVDSPNDSFREAFAPKEQRFGYEAHREKQRFDPYNRSHQNGTDSSNQQKYKENDFSNRFNRTSANNSFNDSQNKQKTPHENMNGYKEHNSYHQQDKHQTYNDSQHWKDSGFESQKNRSYRQSGRHDSYNSQSSFDFSEYSRFFPSRGERSRSQARGQSQAREQGSQSKPDPKSPFGSTPGSKPAEGKSYKDAYGGQDSHGKGPGPSKGPGQGPTQDFTDSQQPEAKMDQPDGMDEDQVNEKAIMDEISDALEEAWQLPTEKERKKVIKRLLLKWHPDKNIGNEIFSTRITQFIQSEIERLEAGLPRPINIDPSNFTQGNPFAGSQSFQRNFEEAYKFFYEQMNQRGKAHGKQRERYKENFSREYTSTKTEYNFDVPPTFSSTNPQPSAAKNFFRQAQADLKAADNDFLGLRSGPSFEWVCFKAHQAAEKALKAAQFSVDAVSSYSHDLPTLAASTDDVRLRLHAMNLQRIVGDAGKLYNPDPIDFVNIPHDRYTQETAEAAVELAAKIIDRVKDFMELPD